MFSESLQNIADSIKKGYKYANIQLKYQVIIYPIDYDLNKNTSGSLVTKCPVLGSGGEGLG